MTLSKIILVGLAISGSPLKKPWASLGCIPRSIWVYDCFPPSLPAIASACARGVPTGSWSFFPDCLPMDFSSHNHLSQFLAMSISCQFCLSGWTWFIRRTSLSSHANQLKITSPQHYEVHQQTCSQLFPTPTPPKGCHASLSKLWFTWAMISIRGYAGSCHKNSRSVWFRKSLEGSVLLLSHHSRGPLRCRQGHIGLISFIDVMFTQKSIQVGECQELEMMERSQILIQHKLFSVLSPSNIWTGTIMVNQDIVC